MRKNIQWIAIAALVVALVATPAFLAPDKVSAMSQMLISALFALAFSLLIGQGGMLSFGHAAYFAIGCFGTVHAMNAAESGWLPLATPLMPLAGGLAALAAGLVAGFFATLRSGVYFSMVTLAIAELLHTLAPNLQGIFGGEGGLSSMRLPWAGIGFDKEIHVYYLVLGWTVLCAVGMYLYTRTSFGRLTVALRENEKRVAFLGYNVHRTKLVVFSISSMFAGVAGGLLAIANENANYILFSLGNSANVVLYSYIGGTGAFLGPAIGAAMMSILGHEISEVTRLWLLYQGLLFVLVMMYIPAGIVPTLQSWAFGGSGRGVQGRRTPRIALLVPMAAISAGSVWLLELASVVFSRAYQGQVAQTQSWPAVSLFRASLAPDQVSTWLIPALIIGAGVVLLWWLTRDPDSRSLAAGVGTGATA